MNLMTYILLHNYVQWLLQLRIPVRVFHAVSDTVTPLEGARQLVQVNSEHQDRAGDNALLLVSGCEGGRQDQH